MKLALHWNAEFIDRGIDPNMGARLWQLTSAAAISHNIYCEQRYTSAGGLRLAFLRSVIGTGPQQLWLCDLRNKRVAQISPTVLGTPASSLYHDSLFYIRPGTTSPRTLVRLDMSSLEEEEVFDFSKCPLTRYHGSTISPDGRYYVSKLRIRGDLWGLYRVDLQRNTWEVFHEHEHICNPHPQFEPSKGRDILVQYNRGSMVDENENVLRLDSGEGTTLYVIDADGGNLRMLPVGRPHTGRVTGHECWVGDTGQVILTSDTEQDPRGNAAPTPNDPSLGYPMREIHLAKPGETSSRCLWGGLRFGHISASSCGRFFVSDDITISRVYVGNVVSNKMLPLCDTGATSASPQYSHTHPYLTPDNKHLIFNSDRTGLAQVWALEVPERFLPALE